MGRSSQRDQGGHVDQRNQRGQRNQHDQAAQHTRTYAAIDLKSFYASVECCDRGLDPLTTNLVVADVSRSAKTICLAVTPALKAHGIPGRPRLFEVEQKVGEINAARRAEAQRAAARGVTVRGEGVKGTATRHAAARRAEAEGDGYEELTYQVAIPRMKRYMDVSSHIYDIYLRFFAPEDILVYSIDEVFIDLTPYLGTYGTTAHELVIKVIREVLGDTGITATAGIGTNMYLAKVAMDIVAKHLPADADGVRIAELDETSYRRRLWTHQPLTDFWRIGPGYAARLRENGMLTMGDVARRSLDNEEQLYRLFGVNAEYLIDHAWGVEPTTIADAHAYQPRANSLGVGQVLPSPYEHKEARIIVREMAEELSYRLVEKGLVTTQVGLDLGYDSSSAETARAVRGEGALTTDWFGRAVPAHAHGQARLAVPTSSANLISAGLLGVFDRQADPDLTIRRITVCAFEVGTAEEVRRRAPAVQLQLDLAGETDGDQEQAALDALDERLAREQRMQEQVLEVRKRFGKNAIVKGTDLLDCARSIERNAQVGGHRA